MKNLYLILAFIALCFYCYKYHSCSFIEGYRNSKVYIGGCPIHKNSLNFINNNSFSSHSIYETGSIKNPYGKSFSGDYPGYYPGYYSN